jgi:hypothetical protein
MMQTNFNNHGIRINQIIGVVLIGLGAIFLGGQVFQFNIFNIFGNIAWPLYVIVPGAALLVLGITTGKRGLPLTIIGSVVTGTGLILAYQTAFDQFQTWAYAWTLYPVFVGGGLILHGLFTAQRELIENGMQTVVIGVGLFAAFWVFFEMLIGLSGSNFVGLGKVIAPLLLIGLGTMIFLRQNQSKAKR